jgi:hypothetical protein
MNFLKSIRVRSTPRVSQEGAIDSRYQMIIPPDWLRKKITVEEAEADNPGISDDRVARFPDAVRPFGFLNRQWETLKAEINKPRFDTALRACARARHAKLEMERPLSSASQQKGAESRFGWSLDRSRRREHRVPRPILKRFEDLGGRGTGEDARLQKLSHDQAGWLRSPNRTATSKPSETRSPNVSRTNNSSDSADHGSTFTLSLPRAACAAVENGLHWWRDDAPLGSWLWQRSLCCTRTLPGHVGRESYFDDQPTPD